VIVKPNNDPAVEARLAKLETTVAKLAAAVDKLVGPQRPDETTTYAIPLDPHDLIEGPADAKVTIIAVYELMDPATPALTALLDGIRKKHPTDVRVAWRYFAVHGAPAIGGGAIECALGAPSAKIRAELYPGGKVHPEKGAFEQLRAIADADPAKPDARRAECETWARDGAKPLAAFGVASPPTVIVNGRILGGIPTNLEAVVAEETAKVDAKIAEGIPAARYYEVEVIAKGAHALQGRFD
jgi:hypothetical protein